MSETTLGETVFNTARLWVLLEDTAGGHAPHIAAVWERMHAPRIGDVVIDATAAATGIYDPSRLGYYARHSGRTWVIVPYDEPLDEIEVNDAEFFSVPGIGTGWPQP